jgi:guanine deaminase
MAIATAAQDSHFIRQAIQTALDHMMAGHGGPFGALVVRHHEVLGLGWNQVTSAHDPTAHAEIVAIRGAAARLHSFELRGCTLYSSCEPCPMCLGAAYWARLDRIVFAATRADAAAAGFDDEELYRELSLPMAARRMPMQQLLREEATVVLEQWKKMPNKMAY